MEQLSVVAEEFLSDATLRRLSGRDELEAVRYLEMTADTSEQTLGDLGRRLPALEELRLSGSNISTLRDLGTALDGLQVLWIARSSLVELEGFGAFLNLRELFAAFNDVVDLSPISGAERLQVLDLEGNAIDDPSQVLYLQECPELSSLNLQDNPCAEAADYRSHVRTALPQLQLLDDEPIAEVAEVAEVAGTYADDAAASAATSTATASSTSTATSALTAAAAAAATTTTAATAPATCTTSDAFISAYLSEATAAAAAGAPPPPRGRGRAQTESASPRCSGAQHQVREAEAGATAEAGAATAAGDRLELTGDRREIALLRDAIKYTDSMRAFDVQSREALAWPGANNP